MLSKFSVKKPFTVVVGIIIIIILGVVSYLNMGVDLLPAMNLPYIVVATISPGSAPDDVEKNITDPIENGLATIGNIASMESMSMEHVSVVILEFTSETDIDKAYTNVNSALDLVTLPDNDLIQEPIVLKINPSLLPIMTLSISQEGKTIKESNDYLNSVIEGIQSVDGVASINTSGLISNLVYLSINSDKITDALISYVEEAAGIELQIPLEMKESIRDELYSAVSTSSDATAEDVLDAIIKAIEDARDTAGADETEEISAAIINLLADEIIKGLVSTDPVTGETVYNEEALDTAQAILDNRNILIPDTEGNQLLYNMLDQIFRRSVSTYLQSQIGDIASMLSPDILQQLIYAQDLDVPAGSYNEGAMEYVVKIGTTINSREELLNLPILNMDIAATAREYIDTFQAVISLFFTVNNGQLTFTQAELASTAQTIHDFFAAYNSNIPLPPFISDIFSGLDPETQQNIIDMFSTMSAEEIEASIRGTMRLLALISPTGVTVPDMDEDGLYPADSVYFFDFNQFNDDLDSMAKIPFSLGTISDMIFFDDSALQTALLYTKVGKIFEGSSAVNLSIEKEPNKSTAEITSAIVEYLQEKQAVDAERGIGLKYTILSNDGDYIDFMLGNVVSNLIIGGLLAIFILLIFLKNIKATLVVGSSILISVVATFVMMYFAGVTLNVLSMGGLALGVGMLVDNSIVIIENIYRMKANGKNIFAASIQGAKQVGGAIFASTLTTIVVFVPIIFIEGLTKQIFTDLALTITFSLIASLVVALTLVPMASSTFLKKPAKKESKLFVAIKKGYVRSLNFFLKHKAIPLVLVFVLLGGAVVGVLGMNSELFPTSDAGSFALSTSINRVALDSYNANRGADEPYLSYDDVSVMMVDCIYEAIKEYPDIIDTVGITTSGSGLQVAGFSLGGDTLSATIMLVDEKERDVGSLYLIDKFNAYFADPKVNKGLFTIEAASSDMMSMLTSGDQAIKLYGNDLDAMKNEAEAIRKLFVTNERTGEYIEGLKAIELSSDSVNEEYRIRIDKEKTVEIFGQMTVGQIYMQVSAALGAANAVHTLKLLDSDGSKNDYELYIYTQDFTVESWYEATDSSGNAANIYLSNNKDDEIDTSENLYYIKNTGSFGTYIKTAKAVVSGDGSSPDENDWSSSFVTAGGRIPLERSGNEFYYTELKANDDGSVSEIKRIFTMASSTVYNTVERKQPLDLVTFLVKSEDMLGTGGEVIEVPLYKLLDDSCFQKDINGNILYRDALGTIPLGLVTSDGFDMINHSDRRRTETITFVYADGADQNAVQKEIDRILTDYKENQMPDTITSLDNNIGNRYVTEVFNTLYLILALAVVLIYLVMVAQFQSLKSPFIVMFTVPLAFTGGIYALLFAGMNLSVMALIGLIVLMGVVVNNGIVFVDYANQLVQAGIPKRMAILRTGMDRMRPILMTALTTIIALISMAADKSEAGTMLRPLALATIGGLAYATLLTLYIVPVVYEIFNKKAKQSERSKAFMMQDIDLISSSEAEDILAEESGSMLFEVVPQKDLGNAVADIGGEIEDVVSPKPRKKDAPVSQNAVGVKKRKLRYTMGSGKKKE